MPGFFITLSILTLTAVWARWLASSRGPSWIALVPAPAGLIWIVSFVFAGATLLAGSSGGVDSAGQQLERVYSAAGMGQWAVLVTTALMVPVTIWALSRPATPPADQVR